MTSLHCSWFFACSTTGPSSVPGTRSIRRRLLTRTTLIGLGMINPQAVAWGWRRFRTRAACTARDPDTNTLPITSSGPLLSEVSAMYRSVHLLWSRYCSTLILGSQPDDARSASALLWDLPASAGQAGRSEAISLGSTAQARQGSFQSVGKNSTRHSYSGRNTAGRGVGW